MTTRLTDDRLNEIRARLCSNACAYAAGDCFAHELLDHIEALTAERPVEGEVAQLIETLTDCCDCADRVDAEQDYDGTWVGSFKRCPTCKAVNALRALTTRAEAAEKALGETRDALRGVIRVADRQTKEFDAARAALKGSGQ